MESVIFSNLNMVALLCALHLLGLRWLRTVSYRLSGLKTYLFKYGRENARRDGPGYGFKLHL